MDIISEELVGEIWLDSSQMDPVQGGREMQKMAKNQPDLLAFVFEFTKDLDDDAKELAVYIYYNVYKMFQKSFKKPIRKIPSEKVIERFEHNEDLIIGMENAHEKFYDRIAGIQLAAQPYIMKYVLEALFEIDDEEDPIELAEDDQGCLFMIFKTVIELLNEATDK
ncbi:hypothetical protein ACFLZM_07130 [Thermodesulfobacteriota bacterium]